MASYLRWCCPGIRQRTLHAACAERALARSASGALPADSAPGVLLRPGRADGLGLWPPWSAATSVPDRFGRADAPCDGRSGIAWLAAEGSNPLPLAFADAGPRNPGAGRGLSGRSCCARRRSAGRLCDAHDRPRGVAGLHQSVIPGACQCSPRSFGLPASEDSAGQPLWRQEQKKAQHEPQCGSRWAHADTCPPRASPA